jgi:glycosyltransferase involved in cell wall biosynthesis
MRIAFIGLRGVPAAYSGVETAVEEIGTRLVELGHDVTVYCMADRGKPRPTTYQGMKLVHIPTLPTKNLAMLIYSLLATVHAVIRRYDLIHLQALGPANATLLCKLGRLPVVVTCHGFDYEREKWGLLARTYLKLGEIVAARFADEVISISKVMADRFLSAHQRRTAVIPNGVKSREHQPLEAGLSRLGLTPRGYILFVGRLVTCKRADQLIRAFRSLDTSLKLVVVGSGPEEDRLRNLASGDDRIILTGAVYGERLASLYSNAALFVLPSVLEGMPLTLLEALSFDLPVLVSDIPENLEIIHSNRQLVAGAFRHDDEAALARAIVANLDAVRNPRAYLCNASIAIKQYNWDDVVQSTLETYKRAQGR